MNDAEYQLHVVTMLSKLSTQMDSLVGNGKPGRVDRLEERATMLERAANRAVGWFTGVGAVLGLLWAALEYYLHRRQ